jgi:hypothetical protein
VTAAGAATGSLPSQAQDGLATAASHVGITLPASHDSHPTKDNHPGNSSHSGASATTPTSNHGAKVSQTARTTDATGRDKGATVSAVARGDHGKTPPTSGTAPQTTTTGPPVSTPNGGGIGTGATASGGANSTGVSHAAPQASAGSGNAGGHPTGP